MTDDRHPRLGAAAGLRLHWPEYGMEFVEMGVYLFSTCTFATLLQHPASPVRHYLANSVIRRACFGLLIGATIAALVLTPWGKQSGGHLNPAITFAFYRLGKVQFWDAIFYGAAQFSGATVGVILVTLLLLGAPAHPTVRYAATLPGRYGLGAAFFAEIAISCVLMLTVLFASNCERLSRYTPYFVGALYVIFITLETPLSGMSMNPARLPLSLSRRLLARALDLFPRANSRHVARSRTLSLGARRHRPLLRQTPPRQQQALHLLPSHREHGYPTTDLPNRGDARMKKWMKIAIPLAALVILVAWYAFRPERLVVNRQVDEAMPTAQTNSQAQLLESGHFYSILHPTQGVAKIYQLGDGARILRLTNFITSNGPDVHVYMVASDDAKDAATVQQAGFIDLGVLKGNIGDQNYQLTGDVDLAKYRAVSIWCKRFSVNFGAAPLKPSSASENVTSTKTESASISSQ